MALFKKEKPLIVETKEDIDINRSTWKVFTVIALTTICSGLAGYFLSKGVFLYGSIALASFLVFFTVQSFLIKSWARIWGSAFLQSFAFLVFFFSIASWDYVLAAFILLYLFLILAFVGSRRELHNSLTIRFWRVSVASLAQSLIGVSAALAVVYMSFFISDGEIIPEETFTEILGSGDSTMRLFIPGFSFDNTLDTTLHDAINANNAVGDKIIAFIDANTPLPVSLLSLPEEQQEQVLDAAIAEVSANIQASIGEAFDPQASLSSNIYNAWVLPWAERLTEEQRAYVGISGIVLVALAVKGIAFLLYIPLIFITFILYQIFLAAGFIVMRMEPCSREILLLK